MQYSRTSVIRKLCSNMSHVKQAALSRFLFSFPFFYLFFLSFLFSVLSFQFLFFYILPSFLPSFFFFNFLLLFFLFLYFLALFVLLLFLFCLIVHWFHFNIFIWLLSQTIICSYIQKDTTEIYHTVTILYIYYMLLSVCSKLLKQLEKTGEASTIMMDNSYV